MKQSTKFGLLLWAVVLIPVVILLFTNPAAAAGYVGGGVVVGFVLNAWTGRINKN